MKNKCSSARARGRIENRTLVGNLSRTVGNYYFSIERKLIDILDFSLRNLSGRNKSFHTEICNREVTRGGCFNFSTILRIAFCFVLARGQFPATFRACAVHFKARLIIGKKKLA